MFRSISSVSHHCCAFIKLTAPNVSNYGTKYNRSGISSSFLSAHSHLRRVNEIGVNTRLGFESKLSGSHGLGYSSVHMSSSLADISEDKELDSHPTFNQEQDDEVYPMKLELSKNVTRNPRNGEEIELYCEALAFKGMGVCRLPDNGYVVLCERALPGERLIARITRRKRGFSQAYKVRTLEPHSHAVDPPCPHFPSCGGCTLQNLAYSAQLAAKQQQVQELMVRVGGLQKQLATFMKPIVPCQQQYHYRNKMEFSFGTRIWSTDKPIRRTESDQVEAQDGDQIGSPAPPVPAPGGGGRRSPNVSPNPGDFALGLHAPKRFDKILPITECLLQHPVANQVLDMVRDYCESRKEDLPAYDIVTHEGLMRHLVLRLGSDAETGEARLSVNIVTKRAAVDLLAPLAHAMAASHPQVACIVNSVNSGLSDGAASCVEEHLLFGERLITETLRGLRFEISANSFFQTNTSQAEVLYGLVEDACNLSGEKKEILVDLFCGTGTIGLSMADKVGHVYGFELVESAVEDAKRNAQLNNIQNATFLQGDLNKLNESFGTLFPSPDVIVTDPNRPGMHPKLIKFLRRCSASRLVYVSCNPATCARDIAMLCQAPDSNEEGQFQLISVQPVDMFPQTTHVECVAVLEKLK